MAGSDWPEATLLRCEGAFHRSAGSDWNALGDARAVPELCPSRHLECSIGELESDFTREDYEHGVAEIVELIRAGDCFQTNLAQRFHCPFNGSVRKLAQTAFHASDPRYGALLETAPGRAIVSMSPELFLEVRLQDGRRVIRTRPIKGTLPSSSNPENSSTVKKMKPSWR